MGSEGAVYCPLHYPFSVHMLNNDTVNRLIKCYSDTFTESPRVRRFSVDHG
jgi:hypothetical protein